MTSTLIAPAPEGRMFGAGLLELELRDLDTTDSFSMMTGRAVPYGEWANIGGFFMESFEPGSLAKSIREAASDLPMNVWHKGDMFPIASAGRAQWRERADGLWGEWKIDRTELAQEAARHAHEKRMTGLSIEFVPIRSQWTRVDDRMWDPDLGPDHMDKVVRQEARLAAVALVQSSAYVGAGIQLVRSAEARDRAEQRRAQGTPVLDAMRAATEALRGA